MNTRFAIAVLVLLLMQPACRREPSTSLTVEFHHLRTADNFLDIGKSIRPTTWETRPPNT